MKHFLLTLCLACSLYGLSAQEPSGLITLDVASYLDRIKVTPNPQILDLRDYGEYQMSHIDGAVCIEPASPDFLEEVSNQLGASDTIFICCRIGKAKDIARLLLSRGGYKTVYNLKGGTVAWEAWKAKQAKKAKAAKKRR